MSNAVKIETKSRVDQLRDGEAAILFGVFRLFMRPHVSVGKRGTFDEESAMLIALADDGERLLVRMDESHVIVGDEELQPGLNVEIHATTEVIPDAYGTGGEHRLLRASRTAILPVS